MTFRLLVLGAGFIAFLASALSTGVPVYYALAAATGAVMILSFISVLLLHFTLKVKTSCQSARVVRGSDVSIRLTVRHACPLPIGPVTIRLNTPTGLGTMEIECPPFKTVNDLYKADCPHRGVYSIGAESALCTDLFGLFSLRVKLPESIRAIEVSPVVRPGTAMVLSSGDTGPEAPNRSSEDDASPSGLREWRDGDELKRVHWKMSLRRQQLQVRTYEESAKPDFLIWLDLTPITALRARRLAIEDAMCESAASAAFTQLGEGYPVRMPLGSSAPVECTGRSAADFGPFLKALTTVSFDSSYPFEQTLAVEMRRMQRTGGAVIITGRLTTRVADIAIQMRRSGLKLRIEWINEAAGREGSELMARLSVYGIDVHRIDPYADLI